MPPAKMPEDKIIAELEIAAGVPLPLDLRESLLIIVCADDWPPRALPNTRETVKLWTDLAKHATAIVELVEGGRGRALAARETLAAFSDYRSKGWLPDHLPQMKLVTDGLGWEEWWQATHNLLETIALTARHQASRASSERQGKRGRRPLTTAQSVRDQIRLIYHHAVADYRKNSGVYPANREEAFIKAVSEHLPARLRGQSADANSTRPRKVAATRKSRSKVGGSRSRT